MKKNIESDMVVVILQICDWKWQVPICVLFLRRPLSKKAITSHPHHIQKAGGSEPLGVVGSLQPWDKLKLPRLSRVKGESLVSISWQRFHWELWSFGNENWRTCQLSSGTWSVVLCHLRKDFQGKEDWFGQKHQMEHSVSDFKQIQLIFWQKNEIQ